MIESLFETCGYIASFLGTFFEGDVMLITSVLSAKLGLFNLYIGLFAAFLGAYTKDALKFIFLSKKGKSWLVNQPKWKERIDRNSTWFDQRPLFFLSIHRLLYGFSSIIILLTAIKEIPFWKFALANFISVALWVTVVGSLAYLCAEVLLDRITWIGEHQWQVIGVLVFIAFLVWLFKHRKENAAWKKEILKI